MASSLQSRAHVMKEKIVTAIADFEKEFPGMGVAVTKKPGQGIEMRVKPTESMSYVVEAGNTRPLGKNEAATIKAKVEGTEQE